MKMKAICILLAITMCLLSGCFADLPGITFPTGFGDLFPSAEPTLICQEQNVNSFIPAQKNVFQSLHKWSCGKAITDYVPFESADRDEYLTSYETNEAVIDQYVAMLTQNGFTLIEKNPDPYLCDYSWKLRCDTAPHAQILNGYSDAHIVIEGFDDGEFYFTYSGDLSMRDLGLRLDGKNVNVFQAGLSAGAGLYRMPDGSFKTTDGRLSASIGSADVIRDGQHLTGETHYRVNKNEWLHVDEFYRNEDFFFAVAAEYTMTGDYYWLHDFKSDGYQFLDDPASNVMTFNNATVPLFLMSADGKRCGPLPFSSRFESIFVRVMHYEEDVATVYYIYAKLNDSTPSELEALCAVSMVPEPEKDDTQSSGGISSGNNGRSCSACGGDGRCNMCGGSGTKNTWTGDSYVLQSCTGAFCSGGSCNQCGGDGKN